MDNTTLTILLVVFVFFWIIVSIVSGLYLGGVFTPTPTPTPATTTSTTTPTTTPTTPTTPTTTGTPTTTTSIPPIILNKFIKSNEVSTGMNEQGSGNVVFLDRHNVNCENNGVNRFRLHGDGSGKMQYVINCVSGGNLKNPITKYTDWNENGYGNDVYLDRHNLQCPNQNVITEFQLENNNNQQMRYRYKCAEATMPLNCRQTSTELGVNGAGNTIYLDRHDVKCADDEAISRIQMKNNDDRIQLQYDYTCCKY